MGGLSLLTAETGYRTAGFDDTPAAELAVRRFHPSLEGITDDRARERAGRAMKLPAGVALEPPVPVEVNHGRWLVQCPDCRTCQVASFTDPRLLCVECDNRAVGGAWRRVGWPDPRTCLLIERALLARPKPSQRNYRPGQTVADLARINRANGLPVAGRPS